MFKGFGYFAIFVFAMLGTQLGSLGPGAGMIFVSLIFVVAGGLGFSLLQFPGSLNPDKIKALLNHATLDKQMNGKQLTADLEELATIIRRDGLLVAESHRKTLKDKKLQYLVKRSLDGFEKKHLVVWVQNQAAYLEDQFEQLQNFLDRVLVIFPIIGLLGSIILLMHQPVSLATAFIPFIMGLLIQLMIQAQYQEKINEAQHASRLYFSILAEGATGIMEGVTAEFLREQLGARMGEIP